MLRFQATLCENSPLSLYLFPCRRTNKYESAVCKPDNKQALLTEDRDNMAKQPKHDVAIGEIKALEDRRYRAMIAGDTAVLDELCSDDLIYTHSKADHDDKASYLQKVGGPLLYLPRDYSSSRPYSCCRGGRARDRTDDGQGTGGRHDRAR
jgi:hypothetical protein